MPDSNLSTSIAAVKTKITTDAPTATVDEILSLARAAKSVGLSEDAAVESAINSRVLTLSSGATTANMVKLANVIKQVRDATSSSGITDINQLTDSSNLLSSGGGGSSVTVSDTAPTSPSAGDQWFDSSSLTMFVYYADGSSNQWVPATPAGQTGATGATGPAGADASNPTPTITSVSPTSYDGTTGTSITVIGTNFDIGSVVSFIDSGGNSVNASSTSIVSQAELTAVTPQAFTAAEGPLDVKVTISDGQNTTTTDAIQTGGTPVWTTATGQIGSSLYKNTTGVSLPIVATDPEGQFVSYTVGSGALAPGLSLAAGTGLITGDITTASITATANYSFTANASDTTGNVTPRTFFINVLNQFDTPYYTYKVSWGGAGDASWGFDYGRTPTGSYISVNAVASEATSNWGGSLNPHTVWTNGNATATNVEALYVANWGAIGTGHTLDIRAYIHSASYSGRTAGITYNDTLTWTTRAIDSGGLHMLTNTTTAVDASLQGNGTANGENFNALQGDVIYVTVYMPLT